MVKKLTSLIKKTLKIKQGAWAKKEDAYLKRNYGFLSFGEMAKKLNRSASAVEKRIWTKKFKKVTQLEYAVYIGDIFHFIGNIESCASYLKVEVGTINYYRSAAYERRTKAGIRIVDLGKWRIEEGKQ